MWPRQGLVQDLGWHVGARAQACLWGEFRTWGEFTASGLWLWGARPMRVGRAGGEQVPLHLETRALGWQAVSLGVSVRLFSEAREQARVQMALCQGKVRGGLGTPFCEGQPVYLQTWGRGGQ